MAPRGKPRQIARLGSGDGLGQDASDRHNNIISADFELIVLNS